MNYREIAVYFEDGDRLVSRFKDWLMSQIKDEDKAQNTYDNVAGRIEKYFPTITPSLRNIASEERGHRTTLNDIKYGLDSLTRRVAIETPGGTTLNPGSIVTYEEYLAESKRARRDDKLPATGRPFVSRL